MSTRNLGRQKRFRIAHLSSSQVFSILNNQNFGQHCFRHGMVLDTCQQVFPKVMMTEDENGLLFVQPLHFGVHEYRLEDEQILPYILIGDYREAVDVPKTQKKYGCVYMPVSFVIGLHEYYKFSKSAGFIKRL